MNKAYLFEIYKISFGINFLGTYYTNFACMSLIVMCPTEMGISVHNISPILGRFLEV